MKAIITNDVECHSFETNTLDENIVSRIENEALPNLLRLYRKHSVKSTFFFTARFADLSPDSVKMVIADGHEVGCHGYDHTDYYDMMDLDEQVEMLKKSKQIIEQVAGQEIVSFRAPALRINKYTVKALEVAGFKYDSSVASQRFDGPFTSGAVEKLKWLNANRKPYRMSHDNPYKKGKSGIVEIPVSALVWPFIGTHMRLSPSVTKIVQYLLMLESRITGKPLVFLFHPNECLNCDFKKTVKRGSWFSDNVRHKLKMKNLGVKSLVLLARVIRLARRNQFRFGMVRDYDI